MTARFAFFVSLLAFTLTACGGEADAPPATPDATADAAPAPEAAPAEAEPAEAPQPPPAFDGPALEVTIQPVGETMAYAQTEVAALAGQTVRLTFENTATNPAMSHNIVVLHAGTDVNAFGTAAMSAADTDYIPADMMDAVIAHTPMSAPGETVTVEFTAPAAGTYTYICTYPGHFAVMQGTLIVAEA